MAARILAMVFIMLGWVPTVAPFPYSSQLLRTPLQLFATKPEGEPNNLVHRSRRIFIKGSVFVSTGVIGSLLSNPMDALAYPQEAADKEKIRKGYKRLEYLLANWEKETTVCKNNDNPYIGCDRSPEKVMDYLGYKSMEDPLFRADKTLRRLQALVSESNEQDSSDFSDALDVFGECNDSILWALLVFDFSSFKVTGLFFDEFIVEKAEEGEFLFSS